MPWILLVFKRMISVWPRYTMILGLATCLLMLAVPAMAEHQKRVLFISSYHPGFPTFFQQIEGVKSVFNKKDILFDIEFMDTKRFPGDEQWKLFRQALEYKLDHTEPYDAMIVADDNALIFAIEQQDRLFKDIPIVFLGINNIDRALAQNANPRITGVIEAVSMTQTIELMIRLLPEATRIAAIVDNTPSGQGDLQNFYQTAQRYPSHEFSDISLAQMTWDDFLKSLAAIEHDTAVLLLSAYKDRDNRTYLFEESLGKIKGVLHLPVFHLWYHGIGQGLLGGKVISHFEQGKAAAQITERILSGTPVSRIEVEKQSPNSYVFDYSELKKNNIDQKLLPKDSVLLNAPDSFYRRYQTVIWTSTGIVAVLSLALLTSVVNILKRLKLEKELKMSEERFQLAMEAVSDGVWDWDIETNQVFYSRGWASILSEDTVEPTYEYWESRIHSDDKTQVLKSLQRHLEDPSRNGHWENEHRLKTATGSWKWVLGRGAVVARNTEGKPMRMVGTMTDISERKMTQMQLQQSEERSQSILQANPNPVVVYDTQGHPEFINESFTKVFGWTLDEIKGGMIPFVPDEEKQLSITKIKEIYKTGEPCQFLTKRFTKSQDILDVTISAAVYKNGKGENTGMVVNLIDLTDQLKLEEQYRQSQKMESIGRLAGGVAHDFNNMLSIILGNIEIILEEMAPSDPFFHNLEEVQKAAQRSSDLTRQLLAFARKQMISPKVLDLNRTIEGTLKMVRRLIGEDIELNWLPDPSLWPVKIDPSQVDQILANLCVNARDSIADVGQVTIETQNVNVDPFDCRIEPNCRPGDYAKVTVRDTGCGMDGETIDNLFEPFFTTKGVGEGTGLGLATVYGIVKQNDGFIQVDSKTGRGTSFEIFLPRYKEALAPEPPKPGEPEIRGGNETILLVEDEIAILKTTRALLEHLGYRVLAANSADEAFQICDSQGSRIHLLMTDVVMPSMNGQVLAGKITQFFPEIKVLYMSGYTADVIASRGVLDRRVNFISKPFSRQDLSVKLREILDE